MANATTIQDDVNDFFEYGSYPIDKPVTSTNAYHLTNDYSGPLYFVPSNCLEINSFQVPKVEMPIIAVVGENNAAQYMV